MNLLLLLIPLILGLLSRAIGLPPLVGYLAAGFVLNSLGVQAPLWLHTMSEWGILLLLFTIGLKLNLRGLLVPQIWGSAVLHMGVIVLAAGGLLVLGALIGLSWVGVMSWGAALLIGFSLSFSSTVFAVKILEERGEMRTRHGQVAIGILIIQDIVAVIFMVVAVDKLPSIWALSLLALPLARPLFNFAMKHAGHGELMALYGLFMAIAGAKLFEYLGVKPDLGALVFGLLLSGQMKSTEMSRALMHFKDLFLLGFFLLIGMEALPEYHDVAVALGLVLLLLPLKGLGFFLLLTQFRLRARTAFLIALELFSFSEFGLIVAAVGVQAGWLEQRWLMILALSLSVSFILAAMINAQAHALYARYERYLHRFQHPERLPPDVPPDIGDAEIMIAGMGRVGKGAYHSMREVFGDKVIGIDADPAQVARHKEAGNRVILGDAEDIDFWHDIDTSRLRLIMLAMPKFSDLAQAVRLLKQLGYQGRIAAVTRFEDDRDTLRKLGVDATFNIYAEAGAGFAASVRRQLYDQGQCLLDEKTDAGTKPADQGSQQV